jgi:GH18 family chitinase
VNNLCAINGLTPVDSCQLKEGTTIKIPSPLWNITDCSGVTPTQSPVDKCIIKTLTEMQQILGATRMKKVIVGLACYGRGVQGVNFSGLSGEELIQKSVGLPHTGPSPATSYLREPGIMSFYEINNYPWTAKGYNNDYGCSIAVDVPNGLWFAYDDPSGGNVVENSIQIKMQSFFQFGVGGVMTFTPQQDDFNKGYPIIQTVSQNFHCKRDNPFQ